MPALVKTPLAPLLWHDSGGVTYHWRALRFRQTLWRPFIDQVDAWLAAWNVPNDQIVIVGPSAGYTLSASWLARFRRIDILEPDPIARCLLRQRFPDAHFYAGDINCFASPSGPAQLRQTYPHSAILFSNVIGQLLNAEGSAAWKHAFLEAMQGRNWASYHDVISTNVAPACTTTISKAATTPLEEILQCFWNGGELHLHDHGSHQMTTQETAYAVWSITPEQHHLVGWNCITVV